MTYIEAKDRLLEYASIIIGNDKKISELENLENNINQASTSEHTYKTALEAMSNCDFERAETLLDTINGYRDANDLTEKCAILLKEQKYKLAIEIMGKEDYQKAKEIFDSLGDYNNSIQLSLDCKTKQMDSNYKKAVIAMKNSNYASAIQLLGTLGDFNDSNELLRICNLKQQIINSKHGDIIRLGKWDSRTIEWTVIAKKNGVIALMAKNYITKMAYNQLNGNITWEICSLRKWLNTEFLNLAFSKEEREMIGVSNIANHDNLNAFTKSKGGSTTTDYVYILSIDEARTLKQIDLKCENEWWLRSPGFTNTMAAFVNIYGEVNAYGKGVTYINGIRPSINIKF